MTKFTMDGGMKCPACAETIKVDASVCKHCGQQFTEQEVEARKKEQSQETRKGCIGLVAIIVMLSLAVSFCTSDSETNRDSPENREKGFHCLSSWDGSHRQFVRMVKDNLRDPESFEHVETRVGPRRSGRHSIVMTYRARNGFGGMNVGTAIGSYNNASCEPRITSIGS